MSSPRWLAITVLAGLSLAGFTAEGSAQEKASLIGRIHDAKTGEPLTSAVLLLDGKPAGANFSAQARFTLQNLEPGRHRVDIRLIGYRPLSVDVSFAAGQTIQRVFELEFTGDQLPDIDVEARNSKVLPRFVEFERRRARGIGHFITRDEIRDRGYTSMGDALRTVKGVRVNCNAIECISTMARATIGCPPTYYVDGEEVHSFGESTPISDVQGIEIYRGASEVPGEYAGARAGCGVIAIWTRATP
ncbi:MAG: carboxypeptidase regulatory-like domain-containing protein [Gemmatimonadota bacterium]